MPSSCDQHAANKYSFLNGFQKESILCIDKEKNQKYIMNDSLRKNGYHQQKQHNPIKNAKKPEKLNESFESIPFLTACLTYSGFYVLMLLGFLNQLLFKPKVAKEQNREVNIY